MDVNNLTNIYNQNPTLQGQYTLQQYLDMFGGSSTTPPATPPATPPNQGIIGADINQYQGGGGGGGGIPSSTMGLTQDFMTATQARQNRLTNPNKVQSFINDFTGTGQADIGEMIRTGQVDTRLTSGLPLGISGMVAKALPDKYYDMSLGDQVFTQSQMGYDGPTVFGDNNLGNKDPFGLNVRSAFGNYAEAVGKDFSKLSSHLGGKTLEKDGGIWNEEKGMFVGPNAAYLNQMNKMNITRWNFRKKQLNVKNKLDAQIKEAEKKRQKDIQEAATKRTYSLSDLQDPSPNDQGQSYAAARARTASRVGSDGKMKAYGLREGGRVKSYFDGGLVSLRRR